MAFIKLLKTNPKESIVFFFQFLSHVLALVFSHQEFLSLTIAINFILIFWYFFKAFMIQIDLSEELQKSHPKIYEQSKGMSKFSGTHLVMVHLVKDHKDEELGISSKKLKNKYLFLNKLSALYLFLVIVVLLLLGIVNYYS